MTTPAPPPPPPSGPPPGAAPSTNPAAPPPPTGPGRLPAQGTAFVAVYRLVVRSVATRGRLVAVGALSLLSTFTALIAQATSPPDPLRAGTDFVAGNLSTLVPVGVLVFAAATLGDPQDDGSMVYLWLRPVPSRVHVLAAWAASLTIALPLVGVPVLIGAAVLHPDGALLGGTVLALVVSITAYAALFVTAGIRFRRALPWGLVYILIWEGFVARAGETASKLAVRSYSRSILAQTTGLNLRLAEFNLASSIVVPLVVGVVALAYASHRLARTDVA